MAEYFLIESRDPFESNDVSYYYNLAKGLAAEGHPVTILLVQNGVLAARPSKGSAALSALEKVGVKILVDDFAVRERGITQLVEGVSVASIDVVVDHLAAGHKVMWH